MEKIITKNSLEEAISEFKILESKIKDLYKQTPVFWYSLNLESNNNEYKIFINTGGFTLQIKDYNE